MYRSSFLPSCAGKNNFIKFRRPQFLFVHRSHSVRRVHLIPRVSRMSEDLR